MRCAVRPRVQFGPTPIDFLLCSPPSLGGIHSLLASLVVLDRPIAGLWLSDHFGLLTELELDAVPPLES